MSLHYIGDIGNKKVFVTKHAEFSLRKRGLHQKEAVEFLNGGYNSYPGNTPGTRKLRGALKNKRIFLVIEELTDKIIIITGGYADAQ